MDVFLWAFFGGVLAWVVAWGLMAATIRRDSRAPVVFFFVGLVAALTGLASGIVGVLCRDVGGC